VAGIAGKVPQGIDGSAEPQLTYDFDEIRECYREMLTHDVCWADFFAEAEITPFTIEYEHFCENLAPELRKLLKFVDRPVGRKLATHVELKRQRDAYTEEVYARFMDDCHRYG
jgi:LPS sulfotransferase NodH